MQLVPIGRLRTPWQTRAECPRNGRIPAPPPECRAEIDEAYRAGLRSLDGFSHLIFLYWLHEAPASDLVFTPPFDDAPRGVFATRAPWRPNPIGIAVVAFDGFAADGALRVRYLDCLDGTPLIDIKPYLRTTDAVADAAMGWLGTDTRSM